MARAKNAIDLHSIDERTLRLSDLLFLQNLVSEESPLNKVEITRYLQQQKLFVSSEGLSFDQVIHFYLLLHQAALSVGNYYKAYEAIITAYLMKSNNSLQTSINAAEADNPNADPVWGTAGNSKPSAHFLYGRVIATSLLATGKSSFIDSISQKSSGGVSGDDIYFDLNRSYTSPEIGVARLKKSFGDLKKHDSLYEMKNLLVEGKRQRILANYSIYFDSITLKALDASLMGFDNGEALVQYLVQSPLNINNNSVGPMFPSVSGVKFSFHGDSAIIFHATTSHVVSRFNELEKNIVKITEIATPLKMTSDQMVECYRKLKKEVPSMDGSLGRNRYPNTRLRLREEMGMDYSDSDRDRMSDEEPSME